MKNFLILAVGAALMCSCVAAKTDDTILQSRNIDEIENYIANHPKDRNNDFLQAKVDVLKKEQESKKSRYAAQMVVNTVDPEADEFAKLMAAQLQDKEALKKRNTEALNQMFSSDRGEKKTILEVANNSDCNMILRIKGASHYDLAVPSKGKNSIILPKGTYNLSSHICKAVYSSTKTLDKGLSMALGTQMTSNNTKAIH